MQPYILICDGMDSEIFKQICSEKSWKVFPSDKPDAQTIDSEISQAQALVVRSQTQVNAALLAKAPHLKLVIRAGEGVDNIDLKLCAQKNIAVANTPFANNNSAAEHALSLMLTMLRKIVPAHQSMQKGEWNKSKLTGRELTDKKVGILGMGKVGCLLAKRLSGFDVKISYFDPFVAEKQLDFKALRLSNIQDVFRQSEIISVHMPLLPQTKNLITYKELCLMSKDAYLVNASRGGIVNEADLIRALQEQKMAGAAIDVFEKEPLDQNSPLRSLNNVLLTPHIGASTQEAQLRVGELVHKSLKFFFLEGQVLHPVKI